MQMLKQTWESYLEIFDGQLYRAILWPVQIVAGCSVLIVYTVLLLAM